MGAATRTEAQEADRAPGLDRELKVRKNWQMALTRFRHNGPAMAGLIVALFSIVVALIAPLIAPYDPAATDFVNINVWPNSKHLFGTDGSGADIFSITILSLRTSYIVAVITQVITLVAGMTVGMVAGFFGGWIDGVLSRLIDVLFSFPNILVAILIAGTFGVPMYQRFGPAGRLYLTVGALSLFNWAGLARVIRSEVLRLREQTYVEASLASGARGGWIITRHMLPNLMGIAAVLSSLGVGFAFTLEAVLSYLGLGVTAPTPSLGRLIQAGQVYIDPFWYQFVFPAVVLAIMVLAYAFIGDGLRDALDPRSQ
ncbi:MAG TPA: ABC transporter permease [Nitrolancea sp.]|nr:ABC transporter permease [Nitrolancea sp.]